MQGGPEQSLVVPLLVLICRNREHVETLSDAKDIKFISGQYDEAQQAFLQVLLSRQLAHKNCRILSLPGDATRKRDALPKIPDSLS